MAHFACISLPYHGHLNPMAALARELVCRGHTATFLHVVDAAPLVTRLGHDFVPLGAATHPKGWLDTATRHLGRVNGPLGISPVMRDFAGMTDMLCRELPQALRALSVDMVLADQFEAAGGMVAYHIGLPFISLAAALPLNWEEGIPSPFVGWSHGDTRWHRYRNIASAYATKVGMRPVGDVIEAYSEQWRLGRGRQIGHYMSGFAQISQLVRGLDFPRQSLIGCFHYCGPLRRQAEPAVTPAPRTQSGRAFASLGTLQGHRVRMFERIARATQACGLDLTIAHGGLLTKDEIARLSRYARVHAFVPQAQVLAEADVAVLHGGLNTVLDAMAAGVPVVVMPLAFEQSAIAARVERAGAGRIARAWRAGTRRLTRLVGDLVHEPPYAGAAARLRDEIRGAGGVRRAADIVEHVVDTGQPCLAS